MKSKFHVLLRAFLAALLIVLFWSVWASAQSATNAIRAEAGGTNAVTAATTNGPAGAPRSFALLREDDLSFFLDRVPFLREHSLFGRPLWKHLALLIFIVVAFYVSKLLDFLINAWLKKWAAKTETQLDDLLLEVLHGPVKVVAFVVFLHVGLDVFELSSAAQVYVSKGLIIIVAISLTYVGLKMIDLLMALWRQRTAAGTDKSFDAQLFPVISKSAKIFTVIVAVLVTASNLHIDITGALASLSVGALAVGLAAQDTLANLFGAVAVYMDKPFRIGDRIKLENVDGVVESIGLRSTRVRSLDGHHITIPNKTVGNATITNVSMRPNIKTEMNFGLTYDTPAEKVQRAAKLLEEIFRAHPKTGDLLIGFSKFADSSLNILVVHFWNGTNYNEYVAGMHQLNLQIKARFDAENICFAFPSQTVYLRQDSDWKLAPSPRS